MEVRGVPECKWRNQWRESAAYLSPTCLSRVEVEVLQGLGLEMGFLYQGKRGEGCLDSILLISSLLSGLSPAQ